MAVRERRRRQGRSTLSRRDMAARVSSSTRPAPLPQLPATCSPARGWCRSSWQRSAICATSSESSAQHRRQLSSAASGLSAQYSQPQQLLQKHQAGLSPRISRCTPSACRHLAARAAPGITALSAVLSLASVAEQTGVLCLQSGSSWPGSAPPVCYSSQACLPVTFLAFACNIQVTSGNVCARNWLQRCSRREIFRKA